MRYLIVLMLAVVISMMTVQMIGKNPLKVLERVVSATKIPIAVAGGLNKQSIPVSVDSLYGQSSANDSRALRTPRYYSVNGPSPVHCVRNIRGRHPGERLYYLVL